MKYRLLLIILAGTLVIAACSPTTSSVEEPAGEAVVEAPEIEVDEIAPEEVGPTLDLPSIDSDIVEVSFSLDVWPILEKYALTAHGGKGGVFLESYEDILSYVEPGNPESSLLYRALIGEGMPQMPPGNPLPDEMILTIHNWIEQGAKEN